MRDITFDIVTNTPLEENAPNFFCGIMYGRHVTVEYLPNQNTLELRLGTSELNSKCINQLKDQLRKYLSYPNIQFQFDSHTICILIEAKDNWFDLLTKMIDVVDEACSSIDLKSGCYLCGKCNEDIYAKKIGDMSAFMCSECSERVGQEMRDALKEKHDNSRFTAYAHSNIEIDENFTFGVLGSIIGGAAGAIIWILSHNIPYVGYTIGGFFLGLFIFIGYKFLAKDITLKGFLFCSALFALAFMLCFNLTESMYIFQTLQRTQTDSATRFSSIFLSLPLYFFDDQFKETLSSHLMSAFLGSLLAIGHRLFLYHREDA